MSAPISGKQAKEAAQRLINSHFGNADQARMSIPARATDDDLTIMAYIEQAESVKRETIKAAIQAVGLAAWKHAGEDAYSRGLDAGACHQLWECLKAVAAMLPASGDGKAPAPKASAEAQSAVANSNPVVKEKDDE